MHCDASGSPTPEIHWFRRGSRIGADTLGVRVEGNKLILSNVQNAEHGAYMCRAVNPAGVDEEVLKLTVIGG
jgi:hypothetical protein